MEEYVLGIDTGGTYTDGVLLEYRSREVIAFAKTLTTRDNLARGIIQVLNDLRIKDPSQVRLVGISSTLATNSIAEAKTRKVALILIGYDPELIARYGLQARFPTQTVAYFKGGHTSQGREKEPLDLAGIESWVNRQQHSVDALAVSAYFSPLNPTHEERTFELIQQNCTLPVVLGHHLSTKLDSIKRATTAGINASLVAVMQEFIAAIRKAIDQRGIQAPLMIVKGDGALMPYEEAVRRPVETVLSGPAASASGGRFLSQKGNALVIDIGGTTTDFVLLDDFRVTVSEDGARVGAFETAVNAAGIRTIGLGCDSRIRFSSEGDTQVGPDRVVPLCRLAAEYPEVEAQIGALKHKKSDLCKASDLEYWFLNKPIDSKNSPERPPREENLLNLLKDGPQSVTRILKEMEAYHVVQLNAAQLHQDGTIEHAALTPTDFLHASGKMNQWCSAVAVQAMEYACALQQTSIAALTKGIMRQMVIQIAKEAIVFLARQKTLPPLPEDIKGVWGQWFIHEAVAGEDPYLNISVTSRYPIIAIGAPAHHFIESVAESLHTGYILPDYAAVANAVGAVASSVIVNKEALIYARETDRAITYVVQIEESSKSFLEIEDAYGYAQKSAARLARQGAVSAGAVEPQITIVKTREGSVERILARASGNPRLSEPQGNPS